MKFVIIAGGQGTKLWPISTEATPKQFQKILYDDSSFAYNIKTLLKAYPAEDILINTKRMYLSRALEQAPQIPLRNYIIEPDAKIGRGPAEGYVFAYMSAKFPSEPMFVVQADNFRKPEDKFLEMASEMDKLVRRDKKLITGGEKATYPTLGVDYLQLGNKIETGGNNELEFYKIDKFVYRSDNYLETKKLIENFHVVIHVNHSVWYPDLFLDEYKKYRPDWYELLIKMQPVLDNEVKVTEIYNQMKKGATEEVTNHTMEESYACLVPFDWIDFGAWNSVYELSTTGNDEVVSSGNVIAVDSRHSLIKCENPDKLVAVYGVENLVIIDTGAALLVLPLDRSEKIKDIVEEIKNKGLNKYL